MRRYIEILTQHRWAVLIATAVLTGVAAYIIATRGVLGSSMLKLFLGESPKYARYLELNEQFGTTDTIFVAYSDPQLFTRDGMSRLRRITDAVALVPQVRRVDSLATTERISSRGDELTITPYGDLFGRPEVDTRALISELRHDRLWSGLLVSQSDTSTALLIEIKADTNRKVEALPALLDAIRAPILREGISQNLIHMAGLVPESAEATAVARATIVRIFPFTVLVLLLVVYWLFRRFWPVLITASVAFVSILWTFAIGVLIDNQINLLMATVPAVMMVVAFSDIIHLCSAYLIELGRGHHKDAAIQKAGADVGVACFYTSATTLIGFVAMAFVPAPVFHQLGLVLGVGVAIALLLALTLVPVFLSVLPEPRADDVRHRHTGVQFSDGLASVCRRLATRQPYLVLAAFAVLAVVTAVGSMRINIETRFVDRLSADNPVRKARAFLQGRFPGTNAVDLHIVADAEDALLDPVMVNKLGQLRDELEATPDVDAALSVVNLYDEMDRLLGTQPEQKTRKLYAQYLLLFDAAGGSGIDRLISPEHNHARMLLRLGDSGLVHTARTADAAVARAQRILGPQVHVEATGITYLFGSWIDFIVAGQKRGLLFSFIATTLMMMLCLRSFGIGLLSMIPNVLPVLALGGYVGWFWEHVDSDTMLVAMIAIGIAVDDTIHFLSRYRIEARAGGTTPELLQRTFAFVGRAMVQTSVILCLGFAPFVTSEYFTTRILGYLLPLTLAIALLADLLLLTALIRVGSIRFRTGAPAEPLATVERRSA